MKHDKRRQFPRRWARLADHHRHAAALCERLARATKAGKPTFQLRRRLLAVELEGGKHRGALLDVLMREQESAELLISDAVHGRRRR